MKLNIVLKIKKYYKICKRNLQSWLILSRISRACGGVVPQHKSVFVYSLWAEAWFNKVTQMAWRVLTGTPRGAARTRSCYSSRGLKTKTRLSLRDDVLLLPPTASLLFTLPCLPAEGMMLFNRFYASKNTHSFFKGESINQVKYKFIFLYTTALGYCMWFFYTL